MTSAHIAEFLECYKGLGCQHSSNKKCQACTIECSPIGQKKARSDCDSVLSMHCFTSTQKAWLISISMLQHAESNYKPKKKWYGKDKKNPADVLEHKSEGYKATSQHIEQTMEWLLSTISRDDEAERRRMNIICRTRTLLTGHNYILRAVKLPRRWTTVHRCQKCGFGFALPRLQRRRQTIRKDNAPFRAITNGAITLCTTLTH